MTDREEQLKMALHNLLCHVAATQKESRVPWAVMQAQDALKSCGWDGIPETDGVCLSAIRHPPFADEDEP